MTDYGEIDVEDIFTSSDPVADWLELKDHEDLAPGTTEGLRQVLQQNENETALQQFLGDRGMGVLDASVQDLFDYKDYLEEKGANDRGIHNKLAESSAFYKELMTMNQTESNPAGYVLSRTDLDTSSPDRVHHTVAEISGFLKSIPQPQIQLLALYSLKYGFRRGACVNTDLKCVHIDHPSYLEWLDEQGIELKEEIRDKPDSIYVYGNFSEGDVVEGEKRTNGNKRENPAIVPIDAELKQALLQYLTIRPETEPPHPLFTGLKPIGGTYGRMSGSAMYQQIIQKYGKRYGITGEDSREDVDLHYFRHFFSTQMSRFRGDHDGSLDDALIKYIRGDKMDDKQQDVLDAVYRHDSWGVNIRDEYLDNIYTFDLFD
ncbi:hypothetical protein CP556_21980 [Natrinema sp. CBA1119]|uniref:tyrosine-type recombinase/integrase n=1 Tax=Natrinema sp. CBA1119 TaxID=1608465 RepID=UPI000BF50DE5|nr:site-specific integrase [Natrinema sp. CBA1119]PGF14363.1 hypothetical protein CP556_21980 [Natrinema sp. CBA1119]